MKFVVIGGGIGGCQTALELSKLGKVILIEKRNEILRGTSDNTPQRLGLGFHYIDIATAKLYLHSAVSFIKEYPEYIIGNKNNSAHPYRRGRYYVIKESLFSLENIYDVYLQLQNEYQRLISIDPSNKVLGEPENFFRILSPDEYGDVVNKDIVIAGIETAEQVLDWAALKVFLIKKIESNKNITVFKSVEISDISQKNNQRGYTIYVKAAQFSTMQTLTADFVVNCTWEQIDKINQLAGLPISSEKFTNRLKVFLEIEFPPYFEKNGPVNSMFFCFGPHCSLTNLGNNKGFLSYEPITNIKEEIFDEGLSSFNKIMYSEIGKKKIEQYGKNILEGASHYIPQIENSKILCTKFGIVKTKGNVDIYSANSSIHKRDYSGVELRQSRWIDNSCIKFLYCVNNANEIVRLIKSNYIFEKIIKRYA